VEELMKRKLAIFIGIIVLIGAYIYFNVEKDSKAEEVVKDIYLQGNENNVGAIEDYFKWSTRYLHTPTHEIVDEINSITLMFGGLENLSFNSYSVDELREGAKRKFSVDDDTTIVFQSSDKSMDNYGYVWVLKEREGRYYPKEVNDYNLVDLLNDNHNALASAKIRQLDTLEFLNIEHNPTGSDYILTGDKEEISAERSVEEVPSADYWLGQWRLEHELLWGKAYIDKAPTSETFDIVFVASEYDWFSEAPKMRLRAKGTLTEEGLQFETNGGSKGLMTHSGEQIIVLANHPDDITPKVEINGTYTNEQHHDFEPVVTVENQTLHLYERSVDDTVTDIHNALSEPVMINSDYAPYITSEQYDYWGETNGENINNFSVSVPALELDYFLHTTELPVLVNDSYIYVRNDANYELMKITQVPEGADMYDVSILRMDANFFNSIEQGWIWQINKN